jgi:sulfatase maturation enzyme AslB (radical SAM superfamily)
MSDLKHISKTFCVHPWTNLMVNNPGTYGFCCIAWRAHLLDKKGNAVYAGNTTPAEAWNADSLRDVRKAMIKGEKLDACSKCWFQEETGKNSYRQRHNQEWVQRLGLKEIERRVEETKDNDGHLSTPPDYLDLRLGNLCNLKCRMCNVFNSNQIEKEHIEFKTNNRYADMWNKQWPSDINGPPYPMDWVEAPEFWNELNGYIPNLKKVYFTGGEPTLLQSTYNFMQEMVDQGVQDKVDLMFNTNCTNAQPRFLEMLSKFKHVQIQASIDGTELVNDYIRAPSHWETIKRNFIALGELPNVKLNMSPAIQIFNVLNIDDIISFGEQVSRKQNRVIDIDFLYVSHPTYLDVSNLSDEIRDRAFLKLQRVQESWLYKKSGVTRNSIDAYLNLLELPRDKKYKENLDDFWDMTEILDKRRNQKFEDYVPELFRYMKDEYNGTKK